MKLVGDLLIQLTNELICYDVVSWIRKRDLHILTVGILTYTNDQRFQSLHTEGGDEWTLRITSPQPRDSGTYECQVSTEPKISQAFRLSVVGHDFLEFLDDREFLDDLKQSSISQSVHRGPLKLSEATPMVDITIQTPVDQSVHRGPLKLPKAIPLVNISIQTPVDQVDIQAMTSGSSWMTQNNPTCRRVSIVVH
ncbi:conserved hypothetical protein [Culex quinquefasciatus]|uniref:Ig-like domain-containing protein n=1 Tax=Culex quinquefasciatus TaxID=7176 RepID=B0X5N5_CULQU|nr:conserved hypothetical protein [Culex quinquefasciatus]|eukprot:XP_001864957.1 conserved hypothetical protein [Culex quinquefasciatus]